MAEPAHADRSGRSRPGAVVRRLVHREREAYAQGQSRPLGGYVGTMVVYGGVVAALAGVGWLTGRRVPERVGPWDVALCALATHKLSRLLSKDPITSPLRAPFTRYQGVSGDAELSEEVRGEGARHAVGELVSCPFCLGQWVGTGFTAGLVLVPRQTRLVAATFAALAGADLLQHLYAQMQDQ
jgi:hypothetical protein